MERCPTCGSVMRMYRGSITLPLSGRKADCMDDWHDLRCKSKDGAFGPRCDRQRGHKGPHTGGGWDWLNLDSASSLAGRPTEEGTDGP